MSGFVADASVTLAWCFSDEGTPLTTSLMTRAIEGESILVPPNWPTEVLNGVLRAKRRGRATEAQIAYFIQNLQSFEALIDRWQDLSLVDTIRGLAERHGLTAYDAAYLELALRSGSPLATLDGALLRAAAAEKVALI
jgi:predicted nucleic acid-binding protein